MSVVASHSHSIPRCDQAFFFQSLCGRIELGGLSAWPHWGPWVGLLATDLELPAERLVQWTSVVLRS